MAVDRIVGFYQEYKITPNVFEITAPSISANSIRQYARGKCKCKRLANCEQEQRNTK